MERLNKWPDEVRLKMIEKSEFYNDGQVYHMVTTMVFKSLLNVTM